MILKRLSRSMDFNRLEIINELKKAQKQLN